MRVLKPKGWAVLQVPINREVTYEDTEIVTPDDRLRVFGQSDHVRSYGKDYYDRLEEAGFRVQLERWTARLDPAFITKCGLSDEEIVLCRKN